MEGSTSSPGLEPQYQANPQSATAPVPLASRYRLPPAFKQAVVLWGMVAAVVLYLLPTPFKNISGDTPNFLVFLLAGLVGLAFTVFMLSQLSRLVGINFNRSIITLAIGYNAVIVAIKLAFAPLALYLTNRTSTFDADAFDPNTPFYYGFVGGIILLLYLAVFAIMYWHFKRRLHIDPHTNLVVKPRHRGRKVFGITGLVVILGIIGLVVTGEAAVLLFPLIYFGSALTYLTYIFAGLGIVVLAAILAAVLLAYRAFAEVEKQAEQTRDATVLASFFWVGLSLILLYHVMWAVFMVALVTTWPFKTYTPK